MKYLSALILLLSFSAIASESFIPDNLDCISESKSTDVQEFSLRKINSLSPTLSVDSHWQESSLAGDHLTMNFSHEGDISIRIQFLKEDLRNLKLGQLPHVTGTLEISFVEVTAITCTELK